jgi:hypothetical protein
MKHKTADTLEAVVHTVEPSLRQIPADVASAAPKPGGWSPKQVIGHLIDSASNNHQRFVRMQQAEHIKLAGYDQEHWVRSQAYAEADWSDLISLWAAYNRHLSYIIRRIPAETLRHECELAPGKVLTLGYLVDDYLGHLEHHLRQIGVYSATTVPYPLPLDRP